LRCDRVRAKWESQEEGFSHVARNHRFDNCCRNSGNIAVAGCRYEQTLEHSDDGPVAGGARQSVSGASVQDLCQLPLKPSRSNQSFALREARGCYRT